MVDDPDAMWRPGYTGPVVYPTRRAPVAAARGRRRNLGVLAGAVVLVAISVAVAVAVVGSGADRPTTTTAAARIPAGSRERWSVTLDVAGVRTLGGSADAIVVVTDEEPPALVALDALTGARRWSVPLPAEPVDAVDVFGHVVVLTVLEPAGRALHGFDLRSGRERWSLSGDAETQPSVDEGQIVVVRGADGSGPARSVQWIDPATGEVESAIEGGDVTLSRSGAQRRTGDEIEVFDRRPLRSRAVVDLAALGLAGQSGVWTVATAAGVVVATRTAVLLVDGGRVLSVTGLPALPLGQRRIGLQALDAEGRLLAVEQGDVLVVVSTSGGELRTLWDDSAWLVDWRVDADRQLLALARVDGSIVSLPPQVVDPATGRAVWAGPASVQRSSPLRTFGDNGFIAVVTPRSGAKVPAVVGYDLDRVEMWRRPLAPDADFQLVDGALVTIDPDEAGRTTLTYYS